MNLLVILNPHPHAGTMSAMRQARTQGEVLPERERTGVLVLTPANFAATIGTSVVIVSPLGWVFEEAGMSKHLKTVLYKAALISMVLGLLGFTIALAASGTWIPLSAGMACLLLFLPIRD